MSRRGVYGDRLAKVFGMATAPAFVTRMLRRTTIAVTEIRCDIENNGFTAPIPIEDALLLQLQLADCPEYELWVAERPMRTAPLRAGVSCIYDLRTQPVAYSISPFHSLNFYLPRRALDSIADMEGVPRAADVNQSPATAADDPTIRALGKSLRPAFRRPAEANRLFVDHVVIALAAHVLRTYSATRSRMPGRPARLVPWQERRIQELLDSRLDGEISISQLAAECGMPVSVLLRVFGDRATVPPHRWLLSRRIDKALDLMRRSQLSLEEIAATCGFSDQRHFARVFNARMGITPDVWRHRLDR